MKRLKYKLYWALFKIAVVAFVVYYVFDFVRNLWIRGNWENKVQVIFAIIVIAILLYLMVCSILYRKWTKRNFIFDRYIRKDRPDETFPLLLLAHKEYKENQKYQINTKKKDKVKKGPEEKTGIIFGKTDDGEWYTSPETEEGNIAVFGFQGTGKTTGKVIPTMINWKGRTFCVDISGDISAVVKRPRHYEYRPDEGIGVYDVLFDVKRAKDKDARLEKLALIAQLLIPDNPTANDNSKYFADNGRKMLNAALIYYYKKGYEFGDMCLEIVKKSAIELLQTVSSDEELLDDVLPLISSFNGANEKNTQGCKESVDAVLKFFATNAKVRNTLRSIDMDKRERGIAPFLLEFLDMFICIPQEKLSIYQPLLRLMVGQMFNYYVGRSLNSETVILFVLDEFGRFGNIDGIVDALGTLRKRKVRVMLLTQNVSDIDAVYGQYTRDAILGNCTFSVCLGAKDIQTQKYFSELAGEHYKTRYGVNTGDNGSRFTIAEERTNIIEPASLAYLHENKKVLLLAPQGYIFLHKNLWFNDPKLKAKAERMKKKYYDKQSGIRTNERTGKGSHSSSKGTNSSSNKRRNCK